MSSAVQYDEASLQQSQSLDLVSQSLAVAGAAAVAPIRPDDSHSPVGGDNSNSMSAGARVHVHPAHSHSRHADNSDSNSREDERTAFAVFSPDPVHVQHLRDPAAPLKRLAYEMRHTHLLTPFERKRRRHPSHIHSPIHALRHRLSLLLRSHWMYLTVLVLIVFEIVVVLTEMFVDSLHRSDATVAAEDALYVISVIVLCVFIAEFLLKMFADGCAFFKAYADVFDLVVRMNVDQGR